MADKNVTGIGRSMAAAFRSALQAASLGNPRPSYTARRPVAQARQLAGTKRGAEAMRDAGVKATARTQRAWLTGKRQPNKANREAIARAYDAMRQGGIPAWVKTADMKITGRVQTGSDIRDRGSNSNAPLLIDLGKFEQSRRYTRGEEGTIWDAIQEALDAGADDDDIEELIAEGMEADIGGSDTWDFPGSGYTVVFSA